MEPLYRYIPNTLSVLRVFLILPFTYSLAYDDMLAVLLIAVTMILTDYFDGYLARKRNVVSDAGKILEPLEAAVEPWKQDVVAGLNRVAQGPTTSFMRERFVPVAAVKNPAAPSKVLSARFRSERGEVIDNSAPESRSRRFVLAWPPG